MTFAFPSASSIDKKRALARNPRLGRGSAPLLNVSIADLQEDVKRPAKKRDFAWFLLLISMGF